MKNTFHSWNEMINGRTEIVPLRQRSVYGSSINVAPKRESGEEKKLCSKAQQKTHAY
ncbi:MAG TPA: hypothetical protein VL727_23405 [Puia sp.]|nr:hypothetical protein [Puia sp.]